MTTTTSANRLLALAGATGVVGDVPCWRKHVSELPEPSDRTRPWTTSPSRGVLVLTGLG